MIIFIKLDILEKLKFNLPIFSKSMLILSSLILLFFEHKNLLFIFQMKKIK